MDRLGHPFVDKDGGGVFPCLGDVLLAEASVEDGREDLALGVRTFEVLILDTVGAR